MSSQVQALKDLLKEWNSHALEVWKFIEARDFDSYNRASQDGKRCFERIAKIVAAMDKADLSLCRPEIDDCVKSWQRNIEVMPEWMKETEQELQRVGKQIAVQRKLGKVYGDSGKPKQGRNLSVKAR